MAHSFRQLQLWFLFEKQLSNKIRRIAEHNKSQSEEWKNSYLQENSIKNVKKQGGKKCNCPCFLDQE